jgi:integrase
MPARKIETKVREKRVLWESKHDGWQADGAHISGARIATQVLADLDEVLQACQQQGFDGIATSNSLPYDGIADNPTASAVPALNGDDMANPETLVVGEWRKTPSELWACTIAWGGNSAIIRERKRDGPFSLRRTVNGEDVWKSLRTRDKDGAIQAAIALLRTAESKRDTARETAKSSSLESLRPDRDGNQPEDRTLTLGRLIDAYWDSAAFEKNKEATKATKTSAARILLGFFGPAKPMEELTSEACTKYELARRKGGIKYTDYDTTPTGSLFAVAKLTDPVKARAVQSDLKFLRSMITWAMNNPKAVGNAFLPSNPMDSYTMPRERNPSKPVMPHDRYLKIYDAARAAAISPSQSSEVREEMMKLSMALPIGEVFGRRAGAIRQLKRTDFTLNRENKYQGAFVKWRFGSDKTGEEDLIPIPPDLAETIDEYLETMPLPSSGYLFWKPGRETPLTTDMLIDMLHKVEKFAGLDPIPEMCWHSLRRKWATERKDLPIGDAMNALGWKDVRTYLGYQIADTNTMLSVLTHDRKLHSDGWMRDADGQRVGDGPAVLG